MSAENHPVPRTVRWAAYALLTYGALVLVNATVMQSFGGWAGAAQYPRAVLRTVGIALVAWGLLRRLVWAYWIGIGLALLWSVSSLAMMVTLVRVAGAEATELLPLNLLITNALGTALLMVAVVLLCARSSRETFQPGAA